MVELNRFRFVFLLGVVCFVGVSFFVSWFLLVGAGFGALGMYFIFPVYERWNNKRIVKQFNKKNDDLIKLKKYLEERRMI